MTNNNNYFDKIKPAKNYGSRVFKETVEYQKKYGFEIGKGEHATWNNEADAFKHTYMQAQLTLLGGEHVAKYLGDKHEKYGNQKMGQSKGEENMDKWNNAQGREIAKEIIQEYGIGATIPSKKINDIIAKKVMERMKEGKLITKPDDKRVYKEGKATGGAAEVDKQQFFSREQIGKMSPEEFEANENSIMEQLKNGQIKSEYYDRFKNYKNSETGKEEIYTREDIAKMSSNEYSRNEKAIMSQMREIGIPNKNELPKNTKTYSNSKADNCKWVTINGNHVLIEK